MTTTNSAVDSVLDLTTGTGKFVGSASPTFTGVPILAAASATSLTFTSTSGIIGTTTNNNAAAGSVGEFISNVIAYANSVSLTTGTDANITSIILPGGDWDVWGNISFYFSAGGTGVNAWTSATSATTPDISLLNSIIATLTDTYNTGLNTPFARYSLATTTTIYLSGASSFGSGTSSACGGIFARRVR